MMMTTSREEGWLELAEVVAPEAALADLKNGQAVCLSLHGAPCNHPLSASVLLQVLTRTGFNNDKAGRTVFVHPLLYCYLNQATFIMSSTTADQDVDTSQGSLFSLAPLPLLEYQSMSTSSMLQEDEESSASSFNRWQIQPIEVHDLDNDCDMFLSCIYAEEPDGVTGMDSEQLATTMTGRMVQEGCILFLSTLEYGFLVVKVTRIECPSVHQFEDRAAFAYRITGRGTCRCHTDPPPHISIDTAENSTQQSKHDVDVPGYEALRMDLLRICQAFPPGHDAAVSGILLVGCSGVGKTRLVQSIAHELRQQTNHGNGSSGAFYMSVQDLIFQASTESNLLEKVLVPKLRDCSVWILDDLALLETEDASGEDGQRRDSEYMMVQNALLEAIDKFHRRCWIIGIAQNESNLPSELIKIGRLEKTVQMLPPTQTQRIQIWNHILDPGEVVDGAREQWTISLARLTPGCVARDLIRAYQDATAKRLIQESDLHDLRRGYLLDSVKKITPSQLEELDVVKPQSFSPQLNDKQVHFESFKTLGGYGVMKKHMYLHVVSPWKHFLSSLDGEKESHGKMSWLEPPPGILFHGKSGTGKTAAAICLATSLQLPLIQVRAADVLDKWLGGSESLLRSLFAKARTASPCILFLDDIDSLAGNREEDDTNDFSSRILSTLLNEMDGVSTSMQSNQVLVIACTNRIGSIDAALLRPGRLQEHVLMEIPTAEDLAAILELCLDGIPVDPSVSLEEVASVLAERKATGADIEGLCREACMIAMRNVDAGADVTVTRSNFDDAIKERFVGSFDDAEDAQVKET